MLIVCLVIICVRVSNWVFLGRLLVVLLSWFISNLFDRFLFWLGFVFIRLRMVIVCGRLFVIMVLMLMIWSVGMVWISMFWRLVRFLSCKVVFRFWWFVREMLLVSVIVLFIIRLSKVIWCIWLLSVLMLKWSICSVGICVVSRCLSLVRFWFCIWILWVVDSLL